MAGKVKKGFGAYMFILLLAVVAAFLIVMVVMICNPFKNILGFQYVYYKGTEDFTNVRGGDPGTIFDLTSLDEIRVNCNYAEVVIERDFDAGSNKIVVDNFIAGFAPESADVDYSVGIYYKAGSNNKILCIDVDEPECSVFFGKRVVVSIQLPKYSTKDFSNTKINISNTSGNVSIGYGDNNAEKMNIKELDIKTTSGKISFGGIVGTKMNNIFIKNETGSVETGDLEVGNFTFITNSGNAKFHNLKATNSCSLQIGDGTFYASKLIGDASVQIKNGYLDIDSVVGDINGNNAAEQMQGATITIKEVSGNVSFPFVNNARITINKITNGKLYARGTTGLVNVSDMRGYAWVEMTTGSVSLHSNQAFEIVTSSGKIDASISASSISKEVIIQSEKGEINLGLNNGLGCNINAMFADGTVRNTNNVTIEGIQNPVFPVQLNSGGTNINLTTDSKISVYVLSDAA